MLFEQLKNEPVQRHVLPEGVIQMSFRHTCGVESLIDAVYETLPPLTVAFSPRLPGELFESLLDKPTWMTGQVKEVAIYDRSFWREIGVRPQFHS